MRKNEYKTLDDFYKEYCGKHSDDYETYIGIDFEYKNINYRLCLEPIGKYYLYRVKKNTSDEMPDFENIGIFESLDKALESKIIDSKQFREIIMDDDTIILGKD